MLKYVPVHCSRSTFYHPRIILFVKTLDGERESIVNTIIGGSEQCTSKQYEFGALYPCGKTPVKSQLEGPIKIYVINMKY